MVSYELRARRAMPGALMGTALLAPADKQGGCGDYLVQVIRPCECLTEMRGKEAVLFRDEATEAPVAEQLAQEVAEPGSESRPPHLSPGGGQQLLLHTSLPLSFDQSGLRITPTHTGDCDGRGSSNCKPGVLLTPQRSGQGLLLLSFWVPDNM